MDTSSQYNQLLCEGILFAEQQNFENAFVQFDKANQLFNNKLEPYFYKACLQINMFRKMHPQSDSKKLNKTLNSAYKDMEKALKLNESCSNLLYFMALVLYCIGKLKDSLKTIEKAIEKAEENYAKYYYLRGLVQFAIKNYQNAISDFTITINLDKNFYNAYLERGKCYFSYGDIKLAFLDIQKYISIMPNDPNIHLWAGNLLFNTGAFEDAAKAYSNSETIKKSENLLLLRTKCYIALKELNSGLTDLNRLVEISSNPNLAIFDRECLLSLKIATTAKNNEDLDATNLNQAAQKLAKLSNFRSCGNIFSYHDYYFYKAIIHYYSHEYSEALSNMDLAWDYKEKSRKEITVNTITGKTINSDDPEAENMIKVLEEFCSDNENNDSMIEDSSNVSFTSHEYLYNRSLILLMVIFYINLLNKFIFS